MRELKVGMFLFLSASLGLAAPTITFKDPIPPDNGKRVFEQMCSGSPQHLGDCTFDLANFNITAVITPSDKAFLNEQTFKATLVSGGQVIASLTQKLDQSSASPVEFELKWTGTKAVSCNSTSSLTLTVEATDKRGTGSPEKGMASLLHDLICNTCVKKTDTKGNGDSSGGSGSPVLIQFLVTNLDDFGHPVVLNLSSTMPWTVSPPLPPSIVLGPGESQEFLLAVNVPAGAPLGSVNEITLISALQGVPDSESSDSIRVSVVPLVLMPTLSQWGLILFALALAGMGLVRILRRPPQRLGS